MRRPTALTIAAGMLALAAAPAASLAQNRCGAAQALLDQAIAADGGPGATAAVVIDGKLVWSGAAGLADVEAGLPMRTDHRMRVGSVSKPITAVAALRLADQGRLDLDAPVRTYVPAFPAKHPVITARQLGSHLSGIRQYDFKNLGEANNTRYLPSLALGFGQWSGDELLSQPGSRFHYSSFGYNLLGAAVEAAAGAPYPQAVQELVARPLALDDTMANDALRIIVRRTGFYTVAARNPMIPWAADGQVVNTLYRDDSDLYPSGGMLSSAPDLARFAYAAFATDFLSSKSRDLLTTPARLADGSEASLDQAGRRPYAFGWYIERDPAGAPGGYAHNGETNGGYALVRYYPARRMAVAATANYNRMAAAPRILQLGGALRDVFEGAGPRRCRAPRP